jgi:hypothetical protein
MLITRSTLGQSRDWMFVCFDVHFDAFAIVLLALMLLVLIQEHADCLEATRQNQPWRSHATPPQEGQQERGKLMKSQQSLATPPTTSLAGICSVPNGKVL